MLRLLSHNRHEVLTGVALLLPDGRRRVECDGTVITMRPMTDEEVEAYVASGEWIGKAGGYAIQETADRFVTAVDGSFTNVVGLPMERVERMLREMGVPRNASEGV
jgi:septum formation protein